MIVATIATAGLAIAVERLASGRHLAAHDCALPSAVALPARFACYLTLWLLWFGIFARPLLAASATLVTLGVLVAISRRKRGLVGEPLVFSDFGLLRLVLRHPDLYYTDTLRHPVTLAGFAVLIAALVIWLWAEPPIVSVAGGLLALTCLTAIVAAGWWGARVAPLAAILERAVPRPDLERHVARWGLLLTLATYALRWRGETAKAWPRATAAPPRDGLVASFDLVVVVQLESFVDLARRDGGLRLPGWAGARAQALLHGRLRVPAHGAYTMRSEFAVLSGLSGEQLGFRRFDPFLSVTARGSPIPKTLPGQAARQGWDTLFVHPFRPGFFDRERVVRRLGFARLLWENDFAAADRRGPYVGDEALARRILAEIDRMTRPALVTAVTMENHGPWNEERLPGLNSPAERYRAHLAGSDRAVALLVEGLSRRPGRALLCLYGDHPPILPEFDAAAPPETDYVLLALGTDAEAAASREVMLTADELGQIVASAVARR